MQVIGSGYAQVKGIDFDEIFALIARLESIHLLLSIACALKVKLYQMDVKNVFFNSF